MNKHHTLSLTNKQNRTDEDNLEIKESDVKVKTKCHPYHPITQFKGLLIDRKILKNMDDKGIHLPTLVQKYVIPLALSQEDLLTCAPTGMGKTLAFLVPTVNSLSAGRSRRGHGPTRRAIRALILTPTRELAMQIFKDCQMLSEGLDIVSAMAYGGPENRRDQVSALRRGADVLIGTPGRLQDFLNDHVIDLSAVEILVFDEADRMLDMGFEKQIRMLLTGLGHMSRQTMMFSATFPESVQQIAQDFFQRAHSEVHIGHGPLENITQELIYTEGPDLKCTFRNDRLLELLAGLGHQVGPRVVPVEIEREKPARLTWKRPSPVVVTKPAAVTSTRLDLPKVVIFVEKKMQCRDLTEFLHRKGIPCISIHGDKQQQEREAALQKFKSGEIPILVATSIVARGLDIPGIELVVNYMLPNDIKDYVHRIGRTGRAGKKGRSVTFISRDDQAQAGALVDILKKANQPVPGFLADLVAARSRPRVSNGSFKRREEKSEPQNVRETPRILPEALDKLEDNLSWENEIS
ncbi:ATP-dependent RNA helicase DDX3X [Nematocida homosporus]|uniref:ATP-dependent RNA helicase DDX3X n=1 Tax=Nematocida homosporus TaxID=1912981 RepID=UPI00221EA243|nr:ATP-dependent RNA helicase DDX3X [Nematocida homosporus]KAI5185405.1 ATP-dependent RNA helicase DDX3X [Nematocida homosporus]